MPRTIFIRNEQSREPQGVAKIGAAGSSRALTIDDFLSAHYGFSVAMAKRALSGTNLDMQLDAHGLVHQTYIRIREARGDLSSAPPQIVQYLKAAFRSTIVDAARALHSDKRGGGMEHVDLDQLILDDATAIHESDVGVAENLGEALSALALNQPRLAQIVELRFFVGLSEVEIARKLNVSARTIRRDWQKVSQLLRESMRSG